MHGSQTATCKMSRRTGTENGMCSRHTCKLFLERSSQTPWLSNVSTRAPVITDSFVSSKLQIEDWKTTLEMIASHICARICLYEHKLCVSIALLFFLRFNRHTQALS